jgi:nucleotide-binding universal stress UspA family protein
MLPIRTILVPTDFSERAEDAFAVACSLARDYGARLVVAYVKAPPTVAYGDLGPIVPDPVFTTADLQARLATLHFYDPDIAVEYRLGEGDPGAEIVRLSKDVSADLIVMGTHGRTGLRRLLLGSVAEAVLRRAPCPVLTIGKPFPEGEGQATVAREMART